MNPAHLERSVDTARDAAHAAKCTAEDRADAIAEQAAAIAQRLVEQGQWLGWIEDRAIPLCDVDLQVKKWSAPTSLETLMAEVISLTARLDDAGSISARLGEITGAQIGSSGYGAQIGSSGNDAQINAAGAGSVVVCAGYDAVVRAGETGAVAITWHDGTRPRISVGYVGENLKPDTWYRLDAAGAFTEAEEV